MISTGLAPFGPAVSEEKIFLTLTNQKQELPLAAIFVGGMGRNEETFCAILFIYNKWCVFIVSSPDPKGHVRYCHHLASVVRRPSNKNIDYV
jgi:hypothetical protein